MTSPQDVFWLQLDKIRVCVVLRVERESARIVFGQGKRNPAVLDEEVLDTSPAGRRMNLNKPTYFRATNIRIVKLSEFNGKQRTCVCPSTLFAKLMILEQAYSLGMTAVVKPQAALPSVPAPIPPPQAIPAAAPKKDPP